MANEETRITTNMKAATLLLCVLLPLAVENLHVCRSVVPSDDQGFVSTLSALPACSLMTLQQLACKMQQQQSIQAGGTSIAKPLVVTSRHPLPKPDSSGSVAYRLR
jgi:hypothetical protein